MAPAYLEKSSPYTVDVLDKNGDVEKTKEQMLDVKLSPPFSPISLNTGAGGRFDVTAGSWLKFSSRIGIAYRRVIARDLFVVKWTDATSSILTLAPVDGSSQFGAEAAITLDLTPLRWFTLKTDLSIIEPFEDYKNYGDIIWFPLGTYVINQATTSTTASSANISISGKDKMCMLDGTCGGTLPSAVTFHET